MGNILKQHGIEPAPERKRQTIWATFLKAHWDVLGSIDFTTIEVWTKGGLVTFYLLFVMEVATRRVHFGGCTTHPTEPWMKQIARSLTDCEDGFLNGKRFLIMDRDTKFTDGFCEILKCQSMEAVKLPPRSPDLNPHIERFVRSIKDESLSRLILEGFTGRPKKLTSRGSQCLVFPSHSSASRVGSDALSFAASNTT